jgi:hypothetical protein
MKRLTSTLMGLALLAIAGGCCCDSCNWCNPCRPCGNGCTVPYGGPPAGAYLSPTSAPAVGFVAPATTTAYYGAPMATAAVVPVESLPTY